MAWAILTDTGTPRRRAGVAQMTLRHLSRRTAGTDAGMVKITDKGPNDGKWPALPLGKSGDLKKGQWVVSLGHPGGPKEGRPPVARLGRVENVNKDIVRSNCTLVGGDSGGPLF